MALGEAILACLTEQDMSGYDLAKRFDASIGFFWQADHQQIYRELGHLRARGDISATEIVQSGRPNKIVYSITDQGRVALKDWSATPSLPRSVKDDLLVRLYVLDHVDREALRAQLVARRAHHVAALARYEQILAERYGGEDDSLHRTGRLLVLDLGLRQERARIEWCDHALSRLRAHEAETNER